MLPVRTGNPNADMAAIMAKVRKMSDSQLADILAGKDVSVPQFAAMTEAMGRKQLRQAVDGAQAMQQAKQPSVKDQLLAEEAGLASLPAPNMESVDMASGGIIAFENGGDVYDRWKALAADEGEGVNKLLDPIYGFFTNRYGKEAKARREEREKQAALSSVANTTFYDDTIDPNLKMRDPNAPVSPATNKTATPGADNPAAARGPAAAAKAAYERRANPFTMSAEKIDMEGLKDRGLGEGLMAASQALLSKRGPGGIGDAFAALGKQAGMTRKEVSELKKDARDYELNRAKAEELFAQGQDKLGYEYSKLAQDKELGLAQIAAMGQSGDLKLLKALQKPGEDLNDTFARMQGFKQAPKTRGDLEKAWATMKPGQRMGYDNDVEKFIAEQMKLSSGLGGGTNQPGTIQLSSGQQSLLDKYK